MCPLSGGWDSRLLVSILSGLRDEGLSALTVNYDNGNDRDERIASQVAAQLGVPHTVLEPPADRYWEDQEAIARASDYQQGLQFAWLAPLARRLAGRPGVAVDGIGGDLLLRDHWIKAHVLDAPDWDAAISRLREQIELNTSGRRAVEPRLERAMRAASRRAFEREATPFRHTHSGLFLAALRTRSIRGISAGAFAVLGPHVATVTPFVTDGVARAALAADPRAKLEGRFYRRLLALAAPAAVAELPATSAGDRPSARPVPQRRRSPEALRGYLALMRESPLRPYFAGALERAVSEEDMSRFMVAGPARRRGSSVARVNRLALLTLWSRRYADRLGELDPSPLLD